MAASTVPLPFLLPLVQVEKGQTCRCGPLYNGFSANQTKQTTRMIRVRVLGRTNLSHYCSQVRIKLFYKTSVCCTLPSQSPNLSRCDARGGTRTTSRGISPAVPGFAPPPMTATHSWALLVTRRDEAGSPSSDSCTVRMVATSTRGERDRSWKHGGREKVANLP